MARDEAYRTAEQKIEEARRSGATELDLSGISLTELPPELWNLRNLKVLKLGYEYTGTKNQLTQIPAEIGNLTQLQALDISHNQLTALPEWLGQLTQLQSLNLFGNQLTTLPEWLGQLTQLQSLNVSYNQLNALPKSLIKFRQLQSLVLSGNPAIVLPKWLGQLSQLKSLDLTSHYNLKVLPEWLGELTQLQSLVIRHTNLENLPEWFGEFIHLQSLDISINPLVPLPEILVKLIRLQSLTAKHNNLRLLPDWLVQLPLLQHLDFGYNKVNDIPLVLNKLEHLITLDLNGNPLNPELAEAYKQGFDAVKVYLRAKTEAQIMLNEAKLILVGEGEVGKTCLADALEGIAWQEHETTHGIRIRPIQVTDPDSGSEITLNGWDFGGQRVYRPTHQLFFSSPAVYLVVWKPREGPQQGFVKEWIQLVKRREPDAKILVVATHGGPGGRQPDIDRQELWDLFGKETVLDFFFVDSKPGLGHRFGQTSLEG